MIAQIGPLVQAGERYPIIGGHIAGGVAGGLTAGVLFGFVGAVIHAGVSVPDAVVLGGLSFILVASVIRDAGLLRLPALGTSRQTPRGWTCSFGEPSGVFAWGFDLGLGFTTRISSYTLLALPAYACLTGDFVGACFAGAVFGAARSVAAVSVATRFGWDAPDAAHALGENQAIILKLSSLGSAVAVLVLLLG
jgi:hypothetical protein